MKPTFTDTLAKTITLVFTGLILLALLLVGPICIAVGLICAVLAVCVLILASPFIILVSVFKGLGKKSKLPSPVYFDRN